MALLHDQQDSLAERDSGPLGNRHSPPLAPGYLLSLHHQELHRWESGGRGSLFLREAAAGTSPAF